MAMIDEVALTAPGLAATFQAADSEEIEKYVSDLPAERIVDVLHTVADLRKTLAIAEKMLCSRIEADGILGTGVLWTAPDGHEYMWAGDRRRECADPEGLRAALAPIVAQSQSPLASRALKAAFKTELKTYISELDKVVKFAPDAESTVRDFVGWREGPRKLRPIEEGK